jgi:predicted dehydrogenase
MSSKIIPVSIIGLGRIGFLHEKDPKRLKPATHFGMWYKNKKAKIVSVCDTDKTKEFLVSRNKKYKIKFFTNPVDLLKKTKPKIVSISTWKDTHYIIARKCIDYGVKVIVLEKPLANNISQAKKLVYHAKKKGVKIIVNHRRRFDTEIIKLKNKIENNYLGLIKQVNCQYVYGILTTGTHVIDTLRMLFEKKYGKIKYVIGIKKNNNNFHSKDDINCDALLFFEKKDLVVSMQNLNIKDYDIFDFAIYGSKKKLKITGIGRTIQIKNIINSPEHSNFKELGKNYFSICDRPRDQFRRLAENALKCLDSKAYPLCDDVDSFKDMLIINQIIKSSKNNSKKIKVKY